MEVSDVSRCGHAKGFKRNMLLPYISKCEQTLKPGMQPGDGRELPRQAMLRVEGM